MNATEAAKKQSFFREVNVRMRDRHESVDVVGDSADFLCGVLERTARVPSR
ncbi:hypothetical protein BH18ACT14_BH18ACT14_01420 [soil metagenome]